VHMIVVIAVQALSLVVPRWIGVMGTTGTCEARQLHELCVAVGKKVECVS